jgi:hypothetical protein
MKTNFATRLVLLCGASLMLVGCPDGPEPGPEPTPTPEPPVVVTPPDNSGDDPAQPNNNIAFDGKTYNITAAGNDFEGAVYLWFDANNGTGAYFLLFLEEGKFRITESQTFEFVSNSDIFEGDFSSGEPGTFAYGAFYKSGDDDETAVTSGTIKVEVSGDSYAFTIDCICEGDKELAIDYTGELEYYGPTGTSTLNVDGIVFPYIIAAAETNNQAVEEYGLYATMLGFYGVNNLQGDMELNSTFALFHSTSTLSAGVYQCLSPDTPEAEAAAKDKFAVGYVDVWDWNDEDNDFYGETTSGNIKIEVEDDIYTITFEDVVLENDWAGATLPMSGTYTGTFASDEMAYGVATTSPKFAKREAMKSKFSKGTKSTKTKRLREFPLLK